jgi:hypothetical protein
VCVLSGALFILLNAAYKLCDIAKNCYKTAEFNQFKKTATLASAARFRN